MIIVTLLARKAFQMSATSGPAPANQNPEISASTAWEALVEQAEQLRGNAEHALSLGLDPRLLVSYARGRCTVAERSHVQEILPRSEWAMRAVTSLVKLARDPSSRAARLLNDVADFSNHSDEEMCRLIERSCSS
jgi:hypothetical protein